MGQNRKKINGKELVLDISYDIAGSVLYALGIYTFAKTADFAPGKLGFGIDHASFVGTSNWYHNACCECSADRAEFFKLDDEDLCSNQQEL